MGNYLVRIIAGFYVLIVGIRSVYKYFTDNSTDITQTLMIVSMLLVICGVAIILTSVRGIVKLREQKVKEMEEAKEGSSKEDSEDSNQEIQEKIPAGKLSLSQRANLVQERQLASEDEDE